MRSKLWLMIAAAALALLAGKEASAQGCSVSYDPSFSLWENVSVDGANIYTQVGIDGSGAMTVEGMCDLPYIYHTALLWNSVGSASSGWQQFGEYCPDCYVSAEQDEELPYDPTQTYTFDYEGQMDCNIGGEFFDVFGSIKISTTYGLLQGIISIPAGNVCVYVPACSSGTPTCGNPTGEDYVGQGGTCSAYSRGSFISALDENGNRECAGVYFQASGPGPCN